MLAIMARVTEYTLRRSPRARRVRVSVDGDGAVSVTLPKRAARREADAAVRELAPWIERRRRALARAAAEVARTPGTVPDLGSELRLVPDWARTLARHVLYEAADSERLEALKASDDSDVAGLAAKIDREEAYHRLHAQMWQHRVAGEPRFAEALDELRPLLDERGEPGEEFSALWEEMTMVRRSVAGATW